MNLLEACLVLPLKELALVGRELCFSLVLVLPVGLLSPMSSGNRSYHSLKDSVVALSVLFKDVDNKVEVPVPVEYVEHALYIQMSKLP